MWEIRRILSGNEIFLGLVYSVDDVAKQAIRNVIAWTKDMDTTILQEQINNAFELPVVDSSSLDERVF